MKHAVIKYFITLLASLEKSNLTIGIKSHFSIYLEIIHSYLVNVFYNSCMSQFFYFFKNILLFDHQFVYTL